MPRKPKETAKQALDLAIDSVLGCASDAKRQRSQIRRAVRLAVAEEREACAAILDANAAEYQSSADQRDQRFMVANPSQKASVAGLAHNCRTLAAAIRARKASR